MEGQGDFPLSTGRPLVGKSAHLHLSWHYFKRGIPPKLEFRGDGGRPVDTATGGRKNWRRPPAPSLPYTLDAQPPTMPSASHLSPPNFHSSPEKNLGF